MLMYLRVFWSLKSARRACLGRPRWRHSDGSGADWLLHRGRCREGGLRCADLGNCREEVGARG